MPDKLVYSSDGPTRKDTKTQGKLSEGPCKMRLEKKGRGGKSVTVLFNLPFSPDDAKALMKKIQTAIGTGATYKNETIEVRGDHRDKVAAFFAKEKIPIIKAGG